MNSRAAFTLLFAFLLFQSSARAANEKDIIGTWEVQLSFMRLQITYTADHMFTADARADAIGRHLAHNTGVWRVEGDEIVSQRNVPELPPGTRSPESREKIVRIDAETLKIESSE